MLHDNMYISHLMVHDQQVQESRINMKIKDARKKKSYDGGTSNGR